jgi:hypothetical protein
MTQQVIPVIFCRHSVSAECNYGQRNGANVWIKALMIEDATGVVAAKGLGAQKLGGATTARNCGLN